MNLLNSFSFELPTRVEYGVGVAGTLLDTLRRMGAKKILVVTDKGIGRSGLLVSISMQLEQGGLVWEIFDETAPNPRDYNVRDGAKRANLLGADCLVAVGGGSPLDCAKAIAAVAPRGGAVRDYAGKDKISGDVIPLIAIPTTAGTGSEVTFGAVITDTREKYKFTIKHPRLAPRVALVDPKMTVTMPPALTASTGMDALTHAIEGYTARVSEPLADAAALYAIELIAKYLKKAVFEGQNLEARAGMLLGSILAGIAFSHSDVGAAHCIAEALGGQYDLAHGVCNAVVLPAVMEFNLPECKEKYARIATAMSIVYEKLDDGARLAVEAVQKLAADVNLPAFSSLGVHAADFEALAKKSALNGSNPNNPRRMGAGDYLKLLKKLRTAG
ncbi:MAG: iron-containing alcohol dehydrogenase [Desulfobacterales bacterium]|nr:MAG: iron-containing alcohol dehydrogenase [Desulfobacterales bacterium]